MVDFGEDRFDEELHDLLALVADAGIKSAARGISSMVGEDLMVSDPLVQMVSLIEVADLLGGPENEAVGIYLRAEGFLSGQIMMVVPAPKALELVDLIMGVPLGTTRHLGTIERSALAELGNLAGSFFLNAAAVATGMEARPTPPAVVVDMVGAILNILLLTWDGLSEYVLMIQATFTRGDREIEAEFWVIPDRSTLDAVKKRKFERNAE